MRRAVIVICIVGGGVALLWLAGAKVTSSMAGDALCEEWPAGLGAAAGVPSRYPVTVENDAARALAAFAVPDALRKELGEAVKREVERASMDELPLPSATGAFLAAHVPELDALEAILTTRPVVWPSDVSRMREAPLPDLRHLLDVQRALFLRAASRHGDPAAWNELHAAWNISRALLQRPELIAALIGLSGARNTNAIARTLPAPAPVWREEMVTTDFARALLAALQAESWMTSRAIRDYSFVNEDEPHAVTAPFVRVLDFVIAPYRRHSAAELVRAERETAASLVANRACIVSEVAFTRGMESRLGRTNVFARVAYPGLGSTWRRVGRMRLELELTSKLLARDFGPRSSCPDGGWLFDGATLRFSSEFASGPHVTEMPLHFRVAR